MLLRTMLPQVINKPINTFGFLISLCFILSIGWYIQQQLLLGWDVSYLLHTTARLLNHGNYLVDFFNPNPPMIMWIYSPAVKIGQLFNNITMVFQIYIFLIIIFVLSLNATLINQIFAYNQRIYVKSFIICFAAVSTLVPLYEFGQREHLFFLLTMSYLLLITLRLQHKFVNKKVIVVVGLCAAIGFNIKPQFFLTCLFIELYLCIHQRNWLSWARLEVGIILSVLLLQLIVIGQFYPEYFVIVMPLASHLYYQGLAQPIYTLISYPLFLYCLLPVVLIPLNTVEKKSDHALFTVLTLALISYLCIFILQRTLFYYHILPALSLALLLFTFLFIAIAQKTKLTIADNRLILTTFMLVILFIYSKMPAIWTILFFYPYLFFAFFTGLFIGIFSVYNQLSVRALVHIGLCITLSFLGYCFLLTSSLYAHYFVITLILLYSLFVLTTTKLHALPRAGIPIVAGTLIFCFPFYATNTLYVSRLAYKEKSGALIQFLQQQAAQKAVMFISTTTVYAFPNIDYSHSKLGQSFDCLWMVPGIENNTEKQSAKMLQQQRDFLVRMITRDIQHYKPKLIFVDTQASKAYIKKDNYSYLDNFSKNDNFMMQWRAYRYFTTLKENHFYELDVYRRTD